MKIYTILVILFIGLPLLSHAQSKKERANNGIVKEIVYEQDYEKGKPVGKQQIALISKFDENGKLVEEIEYKAGKPDKTINYTYDLDGKKLKEIEKNSAGKVTKTTEYKYKDGLKVERVTTDGNNQIKVVKYYKYEKTL